MIKAGRWLADKPDTRFIFQPIFQPYVVIMVNSVATLFLLVAYRLDRVELCSLLRRIPAEEHTR